MPVGSWADSSLEGEARSSTQRLPTFIPTHSKWSCMDLSGASSFSLGVGLFKSDLRELKLKMYLESVFPKSIRILWLHRTFTWGFFWHKYGKPPWGAASVYSVDRAATSSRKINCSPPRGEVCDFSFILDYLLRLFKKDLGICRGR